MYSMLLSASSLCAELIISNNFPLFQMVITVRTINTLQHNISYGRTWIKLSTTSVDQFTLKDKHWLNSWLTHLSTVSSSSCTWGKQGMKFHSDFVYTRNMLINIANNQTLNKTSFITTDTNFPVQGPYFPFLYEFLQIFFPSNI